MIPTINMWLKAKEAARKMSLSPDSIERRGVPWQEDPVPYRIRYKLLFLDEGSDGERRYFEPDCEALLRDPKPRSKGLQMVPQFEA